MASDKKLCRRCGNVAETYNFENDSTFWGTVQHETETTVTKRIRILNHYYRRNPKHGSNMIVADERIALCGDCSGLLIGQFLQGRAVPAVDDGSEFPNSSTEGAK